MRKRVIKPTLITPEKYELYMSFKDHDRFRCNLCGHKFEIGDIFSTIYGQGKTIQDFNGKTFGISNPTICKECDDKFHNDEDLILEEWLQMHRDVYCGKYWSFAQG